jgi:hypothetical protein
MAAGTNKNVAFIAILGVLVPCLIGLWFALPMFLPMYLWTKVNLRAISAASSIPEAKLATKFKLNVRYEPRGEGDPIPWQILASTPAWKDVSPTGEDEDELLVRCTFISANDGEAPGTAFINSTYKDRYFSVEAIRLPPGTLGHNAKRPLIIYDRMSLTRMEISNADMTRRTVQTWENDDLWPERDDGWEAPTAK